MKKVIGYIRVSTTEQDNSVSAQRDKIESYCKLKQMTLVDIIIDNGVSGKVPMDERAGGRNMMDMLRNKRAEHIISTTLDRMFRSASDCLIMTDSWNRAGIDFTFLNMGGQTMDSSTPMGKMMLTMFAAFSELERNMISERITNVLRHKKENLTVYSKTPYGFNAVDGKLVPDEKQMHVVGVINDLNKRGKSLRSIASTLNDMEFPASDGGQWGHSSVKCILKNNIYNNPNICHL